MNPSALLLKAILGTLTTEEAEALRVWREADAANEQLYRQTIDPAFLQREYTKRQSVSHARPLAEMQARIGTRSSKVRLRPFFLGMAASLLIALLAGALAYLFINDQPTQEIQAGSMRAMLTYPNGQVVELTSESLPIPTSACQEGQMAEATMPSGNESISSRDNRGIGSIGELSLVTPRGGEFRVTLEDGTEVWLNAQSRLIYPETFSETERRVQVEGEAYFRVARNEEKPFLVETDGQLIRVLGTEFNVRSYAEDTAVQTTLVHGSIAMQPIGAGEAQLLLTPGHQALFDKSAHDINVHSVDTEVVTSWKDGKFVFENQTLSQIMLTLSRWYDFDYEFLDEAAAKTVFMGRIPRYSDFDDVIAILEHSGGLSIKVKGKRVEVRSEK